MHAIARVLPWCVSACLVSLAWAGAASSQVLIDQAKANAGDVTPGDAPGFPVTLSQPGSYRLTSNLTVSTENTSVLRVTASDVTIDLNGFRLKGPVVCSGPQGNCNANGLGAGVDAGGRSVTVLNGTVRGMGGDGISIGPRSRVERVQVSSNGGAGISAGANSLVTDSTVTLNGAAGIQVEEGSTVTANRVSGNAGDGIATGAGSVVTGNIARANGGAGIFVETYGAVAGNAVTANLGAGVLTSGSAVVGNAAAVNQGTGIEAGDVSVVAKNAVASNAGALSLVASRSVVTANAVLAGGANGISVFRSVATGNATIAPTFGLMLDRSGFGGNAIAGISSSDSLGIDCNFRTDVTPAIRSGCPP